MEYGVRRVYYSFKGIHQKKKLLHTDNGQKMLAGYFNCIQPSQI